MPKNLRPAELSFSGYTLSSSGSYFNSLLLVAALADSPSSKAKQAHQEYLAKLLDQQKPYIQRILTADAILSEAGFGCPKKPHYPAEFFNWEEKLRTAFEDRYREGTEENRYFSLGWRLGDLQTDLDLLSLSSDLHLRLYEERHYSNQIRSLLHSIIELEPLVLESLSGIKFWSKTKEGTNPLPEFKKIFSLARIHSQLPEIPNDRLQTLRAASSELSHHCATTAQRIIERLEARDAA